MGVPEEKVSQALADMDEAIEWLAELGWTPAQVREEVENIIAGLRDDDVFKPGVGA